MRIPIYRIKMSCPRCGKTYEIIAIRPRPHVNCGDCLMDRVEIVEMTIDYAATEPTLNNLTEKDEWRIN